MSARVFQESNVTHKRGDHSDFLFEFRLTQYVINVHVLSFHWSYLVKLRCMLVLAPLDKTFSKPDSDATLTACKPF